MVQKTKKERQKWFYSLSPEQRQAFIERKVKQKSIKRRNNSLKVMKKYKSKYKCSECHHGIGGHCTDNLPNGCECWYNPNAKQSFGINLGNKSLETPRK